MCPKVVVESSNYNSKLQSGFSELWQLTVLWLGGKLWLTYEARKNPELPCDTVLAVHEWQSLYCKIHNCSIAPSKPPSLWQAVRWIAQLGGFLGRTHDGEPGVKTIWRGLRRLQDISSTWKLLRPDSFEREVFGTYG